MTPELDLAHVITLGEKPDQRISGHHEQGADVLLLERLESLVDGVIGADGIHPGSLVPEDAIDRVVEFHQRPPC